MVKDSSENSALNPDLRVVFDSVNDSIIVLDRNMIVVDANQSLSKNFQTPQEEIIGRPVSDFFPKEVSEFRIPIYEEVFKDKVTIEYESARDGIWYQSKVSPLFDADGNVAHVSIIARDITEKREDSEKLRKSEAQFRNYFDLGLVGMTVSSLHRNWLHVNDRMCEMLGYTWRELTSVDIMSLTHPDDQERDAEDFWKIVEGEIESFNKEKRYIHKNGDVVYVKISARGVKNDEGDIDHLVALIDDITERKLAQDALARSYSELESRVEERTRQLKQSEGNLREFALTAVDSYWETDADLNIVYASKNRPAEKLKNRKVIIGKNIGEISTDFSQGEEWQAFLKALETQEAFRDMIMPNEDSEGNRIFVRRSASPILDADGKFTGYRGTTTNVTEDILAKEKAAQAEKKYLDTVREKSESEELMLKISSASNRANSLEEAYQACIDEVCGYTGWPFAHVWNVPEGQSKLFESSGIWYVEDKVKYAPLIEHTYNNDKQLSKSKLAEVLASGESYWSGEMPKITGSRRAKIVEQCGGKGAVLFPLKINGKVFAILEFVLDNWSERDVGFTSILQQIELQLGHVLEREQVKDEIRKGEERFRDYAGSVADRFWETDADFRYIYVTPPAGNLTNVLENLLGRAPWEVVGSDGDNPNWDWLKKEVSEHKAFRDFEYSWLGNNGVVRPLKASGTPYYDKNGEYLGYRGTTIDQTSIVEARAQTEDIQNQFYEAMENLDAGFVLWDANDEFVMCNSFYKSIQTAAKDFLEPGVKHADYIHHIANSEWAKRNFENLEGWAEERIADHQNPSIPLEYHLDDGRWFRIRKQRMANDYKIVFHIDVTDIKQRELELHGAIQEAEAANRTKSEFLANMSHELRTPLNAVIGFSDALKHGVFGDLANINQLDYLNNIHEAGSHLLELINDILDVSAIEAGQFELKEEVVSLSDISDSTLKFIAQRALDGGVIIANYLSESDVSLLVDELRFKQILLNLLSNAVKFTPSGGEVSLDMDKSLKDSVTISISDTGIGMSELDLRTAMTTFGQIESHLSREHEGTGLGIPLTKSLIEAHGGFLEIESEIGVGTTVTIHLPKDRLIT
ncbi:MAG: PAS domain S-box protein [Rhodospirillaceae bacterium]|nr:PAS domain S-box protein [Rhodospirillaceae bacterium]MBT5938458.1 PAS domain S-box protein [Rhodospirillaceae bacterium]MBT7267322.1 PAS domain S-box protein [Rhodospirillaceae bacterium]